LDLHGLPIGLVKLLNPIRNFIIVNKKTLSGLCFAICALEGVWVLLSLWDKPASGVNSIFQTLSFARLVFIALIIVLVGTFIGLAFHEWWTKPGQMTLAQSLFSRRLSFVMIFSLLILGFALGYIMVFSPLRLERLHGYFLRWKPFFIWILLIILQLVGLAFLLNGPTYWAKAWRDLLNQERFRRLVKFTYSRKAGVLLLILSFVIGLTKVYYGRFVDEADNLTVGWLLSEGQILYRDIFSHHFPFPYYWVALVVRLFGNSFAAVRISVLLLQIGVFAISMGISRFYLALGLTSVVWNLTNQFLRGQEAIYPTFEGILMLGAFTLIFFLLVKRQKPGKLTLALIGVFLAFSLLTDPLMIYPILIAFAGLFISGAIKSPAKRVMEAFNRTLIAGTIFAAVLGIYAIHLVSQGSAQDFYQDTIWFNREIYAKYEYAEPFRMVPIGQQALTGLNILNPQWTQQTSPFLPLNTYRSVRLEDEGLYNSWIFAGLLFRLSILICLAGLFLQRRGTAGVILYIFAAASLVREDYGIYSIGFTLVSLFAGFYTLVNLHRPALLRSLSSHTSRFPDLIRKISRMTWSMALILIGTMTSWSAFRGAYYLADHPVEILNPRHVNQYKNFGEQIRDLACNQPDLEIAVYPINPIVYFVTEIPPASKYTFMYPWVAEVGQQEMISELRNNPGVVVWLRTGRGAGDNAAAVYLRDTINFLNEEYVFVSTDIWMSPDLAARCGIVPSETQFTQPDDVDGE